MSKSSFIALVLGAVSCVFFAMGMCMTMVAEWNAFHPGVVVGCVGLVIAMINYLVWRKAEQKAPIQIKAKAVGTIFVGIVGALAVGVGMSFVMVWGNLVPGVLVGIVGLILLLCLIPMCKGLK